MRPGLASVFAAALLGGCSLLYNPSNLPPPTSEAGADTPRDMEIILDTDPAALELEGVFPATLVEGTGAGGSAPQILIVHARQLIAGAKVSLTSHADNTVPATIAIDNDHLQVALDGRTLAVPVTIAVDPSHGAGATALALDVTVTQANGTGGMVSKTLAAPLTLTYLDELTDASLTNNLIGTGVHDYAMVDIAANGLKPADTAAPLVIRSRSSLKIVGDINVSATDANGPGPGGNLGGAGGATSLGGGTPGSPGSGPGGGLPSGAGGGFKTRGADGPTANTGGAIAGTDAITTLDLPNRSSGGSGGAGGATIGGTVGGTGGAGGGSVELSAAGDVMIGGAVTANGGKGTSGTPGLGGGGSGGLVLIRGGKSVAVTSISATQGAGPGGAGSVGRVRVDVPATQTIASTPAKPYRGPMFSSYPAITFETMPMVEVIGEPSAPFTYFYVAEDASIIGPINKTIGTDGKAKFTLGMELARGLDRVCLLVDGATTQSPAEAMNCVDIAYLYKP